MLQKIFDRISGSKKEITINRLATGAVFGGPLAVGVDDHQIRMNSVVGCCLSALTSATALAPLVVEQQNGTEWDIVEKPDLLRPLIEPELGLGFQQDFSNLMWGATVSDRIDGNVYMMLVRSLTKAIVGVQYVPHTAVNVESDAQGRLIRYRVSTGARSVEVAPEDMIHIRLGIDSANPLLGVSPFASFMREVLTDNEIAAFSHSVLRQPWPAAFVNPEGLQTQEQLDQIKAQLRAMTTGEGRGRLLLSPIKLDVTPSGFNPDDMALDTLGDRPEERICANMGVPSVIAGVGAGLDRSTYNNYEQAEKQFYGGTVTSIWKRLERGLNKDLMPKLVRPGESGKYRYRFDTSGVVALNESEDRLIERADKLFRSNLISRGESRRMIGMDSTPEDDSTYFFMLGPGSLLLNGGKVRAEVEKNV